MLLRLSPGTHSWTGTPTPQACQSLLILWVKATRGTIRWHCSSLSRLLHIILITNNQSNVVLVDINNQLLTACENYSVNK